VNPAKNKKEMVTLKIIEFCPPHSSKCPVIKEMDDGRVEIGEPGNLCVLTAGQWSDLKKKINTLGD